MSEDLISRRVAIEALGEEPEVWNGKDEYEMGLNNQWHYDRNAIMEVPAAEPRWIPVTERVPEKYGWYLVTVEHGLVYKCFYQEYWVGWKVLAWMPLPKPWKGESDG